jgi:uncharacterized heparinase superfamily protein
MRTPLYDLLLAKKKPTGFCKLPLVAYPSIPNTDATNSILEGHLSIAGSTAPINENIWATEGPSQHWLIAANGFAWLGDLLSEETPDAVEKALRLIDQWIDRHMKYSDLVWRSDIAGRRIVNWICWAPLLFQHAGPSFRDLFCEGLARQIQHLKHVSAFDQDGDKRIAALTGRLFGEVVFDGQPEVSKRLATRLSIELERQIMADGGHASRCPETHLTVLTDLVAMRAVLTAGQVAIPDCISNAIDRLSPMVRFFRHPDGAFSQFNGGSESNPELIDHVMKLAASNGKPPTRAPHAGFERVTSGQFTLLLDTGAPPDTGMNKDSHAGTLSFELSVGQERLIVNCGSRANLDDEWRWAGRATAAHSTVSIGDANSSALIKEGGVLPHPLTIECDRGERDGNSWLSTSHTGYHSAFGLTHRRRLYIDATGLDLRGEDTIVGEGVHPFIARFHLHPDVSVSLLQNGNTALLRTGSGTGWHFRVSGGVLEIADSVYLGGRTMARRSKQLVVPGITSADATTLKWALQRH